MNSSKKDVKSEQVKEELNPENSFAEQVLAEATDEEIAEMAAYALAVEKDVADRI